MLEGLASKTTRLTSECPNVRFVNRAEVICFIISRFNKTEFHSLKIMHHEWNSSCFLPISRYARPTGRQQRRCRIENAASGDVESKMLLLGGRRWTGGHNCIFGPTRRRRHTRALPWQRVSDNVRRSRNCTESMITENSSGQRKRK